MFVGFQMSYPNDGYQPDKVKAAADTSAAAAFYKDIATSRGTSLDVLYHGHLIHSDHAKLEWLHHHQPTIIMTDESVTPHKRRHCHAEAQAAKIAAHQSLSTEQAQIGAGPNSYVKPGEHPSNYYENPTTQPNGIGNFVSGLFGAVGGFLRGLTLGYGNFGYGHPWNMGLASGLLGGSLASPLAFNSWGNQYANPADIGAYSPLANLSGIGAYGSYANLYGGAPYMYGYGRHAYFRNLLAANALQNSYLNQYPTVGGLA